MITIVNIIFIYYGKITNTNSRYSPTKDFGNDIKVARIRRRITSELMAQRIGISRITLAAIEKGSPTVSFGYVATALWILGLSENLKKVASIECDPVGKALSEQDLPKRVVLKRKKS